MGARLYARGARAGSIRAMPIRHVVAQGECLTSIAASYGFSDYRLIYDDPANEAFKQRRKDPHVIFPGDVLTIPDRGGKEESCDTGKEHRFTVKLGRRLLRIALRDHEDKAIAGVDYVLAVDGQDLTGKTDGDGILEQTVPAQASQGVVTLPKFGVKWGIQIGHLDPVHDHDADEAILSGVRARLVNLGYLAGGEGNAEVKEAIAEFQRDALGREEPDGVPDRETRDALLDRHGC